MQRLSGLDYLRGISALGIMLFHFKLWNYGIEPSESVFTRIGMYGVSIFYVLSGLTLYHVYNEKLNSSLESILSFYGKRILRIFPLMWLSSILTILIEKRFPDTSLLFSNLSGLFAFYNWANTITYGAWSVGNELSFYLAFPFLILFLKRWNKLYYTFLVLSFLLMVYFAFNVIDPNVEFIQQWDLYTNPLNQFFLFISGVGLGALLKKMDILSIQAKVILVISLLVFSFYPTSGDRVQLVVGVNRLVFAIASVGICAGIYKSNFRLPSFLNKFLVMLGHASYSIYLLHPLVYRVISKVCSIVNQKFFEVPVPAVIFIASVATISFSYFVYLNFETFFTGLGKKIPGKERVKVANKVAVADYAEK